MGAFVTLVIEFARTHRELAYGLMLVVALSEALPVIGAFVPGDAITIGIGALVATGALRLWPLIIAATLGAILGDGISYWLGHRYHHTITSRWPLKRHPVLIARGEAFIQRHGGKSVFIGRFTPGVRAVVPLIAGMLQMSPLRFYIMNVISAVVWAPTHVLAGAAVGASLVLLGTIANRLLVFVVVLTALLAVIIWATYYAVRRLPPLIAKAQEKIRAWAQGRNTWLGRQLLSILDPARKELPGLAFLGAILVGGLWCFLGVLQDVIAGDPLVRANVAVFHFLQALRTGWVDRLMVAITELGDANVTLAVALVTFLWLAWRRNWRGTAYEAAAVAVAGLFAVLFKITLHVQRPEAIHSGWDAFAFPSGHSAVNAALYGFLAIVVSWEVSARWRFAVASAAALLVIGIAFSRVYLGAHWISDVLAGLAFGVAWAALLGIAYLRRNPPPVRAAGFCTLVGLTLLVVGAAHIGETHAADMEHYAVRGHVHTMALTKWWQRGWSMLPARRIDLTGEIEEPLTFQWAGSRKALEAELATKGWAVPVPWTARSTLAWLKPAVDLATLPVLPRLENGREEALVMVRPVAAEAGDARLVLRLWRSDVMLSAADSAMVPLWIGTVAEEHIERLMSIVTTTHRLPNLNEPRNALASSIETGHLAERGPEFREPGWDGGVLLGHSPDVQPLTK